MTRLARNMAAMQSELTEMRKKLQVVAREVDKIEDHVKPVLNQLEFILGRVACQILETGQITIYTGTNSGYLFKTAIPLNGKLREMITKEGIAAKIKANLPGKPTEEGLKTGIQKVANAVEKGVDLLREISMEENLSFAGVLRILADMLSLESEET